jgi:hypothetical protein
MASPQTKKKYEYHFKSFIKHFDVTLSQSLLVPNYPRPIEGMIIAYIKYLANERHQSYATIHHTVSPNMSTIFLDEADFFPTGKQQDANVMEFFLILYHSINL